MSKSQNLKSIDLLPDTQKALKANMVKLDNANRAINLLCKHIRTGCKDGDVEGLNKMLEPLGVCLMTRGLE